MVGCQIERLQQQSVAAQTDATHTAARLREDLATARERLRTTEAKLQEVQLREQHARSLNARLAAVVRAQKEQGRSVAREDEELRKQLDALRRREATGGEVAAEAEARVAELRLKVTSATARAEAEAEAARVARAAVAQLEVRAVLRVSCWGSDLVK